MGGGGPLGGGANFADAAAALRQTSRDRSLFRPVTVLFRPYRRAVYGVGVSVLLSSSLGIVSPLLIKVVLDQGLFSKGSPNIPLLLAALAAASPDRGEAFSA